MAPVESPNQLPMSDHDLLLTLNANVSSLKDDVKTSMGAQTIQLTDHEGRLRSLETNDAQTIGSRRTVTTALTILGIATSVSLALTAWIALVPHK